MVSTCCVRAVRRAVRARGVFGAALCLALLLAASRADATPLYLTPSTPDITATVDISYVGGVLTATLSSGVGNYHPGGFNITNLSYSLSANVDAAGVFSGGTVSISGAIASLGIAQSTLMTGNLTDFGLDAELGVFEFLFDTTASEPAMDLGPTGGIILSSFLSDVDFLAPFTSRATSDTFTEPVAAPEPALLALLALGSLGALRRRVGR